MAEGLGVSPAWRYKSHRTDPDPNIPFQWQTSGEVQSQSFHTLTPRICQICFVLVKIPEIRCESHGSPSQDRVLEGPTGPGSGEFPRPGFQLAVMSVTGVIRARPSNKRGVFDVCDSGL